MPALQSRLRVRRATAADAPACQEIRYTAFRPTPMSRLIFPGDMSEATMDMQIANTRADIASDGQDLSRVHVLVAELLPEESAANGAADASPTHPSAEAAGPALSTAATAAVCESHEDGSGSGSILEQGLAPRPRLDRLRNRDTGGTVIAFARWHLYREERAAEEYARPRPFTRESMGDGTDLDVCEAYLGAMRGLRQQHIKGQAHFILSLLACSPLHQRRGAATALLRWGTDLGDSEGLACWLDATPAGYPVYARCGFRDVAVLDLNVTGRWGLIREEHEDWGNRNGADVAGNVPPDGWFRTVLMRRDAHGPRAEKECGVLDTV